MARPRGRDRRSILCFRPRVKDDTEYYAVFYHGLNTISVPFDRKTNSSDHPGAV
jgi:hypothetical protein